MRIPSGPARFFCRPQVGRDILTSLQRLRGPCGFAMVANVDTGELADSMESFFLSETVKYLFLLFDAGASDAAATGGGTPLGSNFVDSGPYKYVFTTEGHIIPLKPELMFQKRRGAEVGSGVTKLSPRICCGAFNAAG